MFAAKSHNSSVGLLIPSNYRIRVSLPLSLAPASPSHQFRAMTNIKTSCSLVQFFYKFNYKCAVFLYAQFAAALLVAAVQWNTSTHCRNSILLVCASRWQRKFTNEAGLNARERKHKNKFSK